VYRIDVRKAVLVYCLLSQFAVRHPDTRYCIMGGGVSCCTITIDITKSWKIWVMPAATNASNKRYAERSRYRQVVETDPCHRPTSDATAISWNASLICCASIIGQLHEGYSEDPLNPAYLQTAAR
jgi:hypothetical protein